MSYWNKKEMLWDLYFVTTEVLFEMSSIGWKIHRQRHGSKRWTYWHEEAYIDTARNERVVQRVCSTPKCETVLETLGRKDNGQ